MDTWKFYDITHRDHIVCNPIGLEKIDELVAILDLPEAARVLDIACGKAEFLFRLASRSGITGDGVDLSPYCIRDARARAAERAGAATLRFHEQDGAEFDAPAASYDLAACVGATWTFGGYRATLQALARAVRPGGQVLVGEPFWRHSQSSARLNAAGERFDTYATHAVNVATGVELGLVPLYTIVSSHEDWDRYKGLQWRAAERYAAANPPDPDVPELLQRVRRQRDAYLRWERDAYGWALYLFRVD